MALLSSYSIHLLLKSSGIVGERRDPSSRRGCAWIPPQPSLRLPSPLTGIRAYEQLGYRAFGTPGKLAAAIAITLQNIGGEELGGAFLGWGHGDRGHRAAPATLSSLCPAAMSSYLYIVKSEVPLVIQTFLNLEEKTA